MRPTVIALFCLATTLTAQAQPPASVREAQTEHEIALTKIRAAYEETVQKAAAEYKAKLGTIQADLAKDGKLDSALAVRGMLKEFDEAALPPPGRTKEQIARDQFAAELPKLTWLAAGPPGWGGGKQAFAFGPDGYVYRPLGTKMTTAWAAVSHDTLVVMMPNAADTPVDVFSISMEKGTIKVRCIGNLKSVPPSPDAIRVK